MKKIFQITFIILLFSNPIQAKTQYLQEGINLFKNKKFRKAQFKFEKILYLILEVNYLICIYQKYSKN